MKPRVFNPHRTLQKDGTVAEGFAEREVVDALHGPTGNKEPLVVFGSAPSSAASAASTSASSEPVCASCGSARPIRTGDRCCDDTGLMCLATRTWQAFAANQRDEVRELDVAGALAAEPGMKQQTFLALTPWDSQRMRIHDSRGTFPTLGAEEGRGHNVPMVLTSSAEASPAKTSALPADAPGSTDPAAPSSSSSHESLSLFVPAGFSSRTYPDYFLLTVAEISPSYSRRWPSSGMAFAGECWTLDSSEFPSGAGECSLSGILEPEVPSRFYLSSRAARGILRRARRRGKMLPEHLAAALESVAGAMTSTGRPS